MSKAPLIRPETIHAYERWCRVDGSYYNRQDIINYIENQTNTLTLNKLPNNRNDSSSDSEDEPKSPNEKTKKTEAKKDTVKQKKISIITCFNNMYDKNKNYFSKFVDEKALISQNKNIISNLGKKQAHIYIRKLVYKHMKKNYAYILKELKSEADLPKEAPSKSDDDSDQESASCNPEDTPENINDVNSKSVAEGSENDAYFELSKKDIKKNINLLRTLIMNEPKDWNLSECPQKN